MTDFETLGVFYLGRLCDPSSGARRDDLLLYDSRDLTTHAVCVGMTGSGKTGLCLALIEEAALDKIPVIAVDPKGDLVNLLLTFPDLRPEDFRPWVDPGEAERKGLTPDALAAQTAGQWRSGLADWGMEPARIRALRESAEFAVYTPGSGAGRPLTLLRSFAVPPPGPAADDGAVRDRLSAAVSGLLGLLGIQADPVRSREHILIANVLDRAWREGRSLDLEGIIREVQKPPFEKIGAFDLETFFPSRERLELAMLLNNLLASPGFAAWMQGDPLDIQRLLYTADGRPRVAILSIAHLSDAERMFFVTILLNELVSWMRQQSGTSSLRALFYMDEVFGYFPPTAAPPSKLPMLTLLKQARAYGLGIVLATQNPVDLDYKGLGNAGTWFVGRLQTDRDKMRVIEGLEGAAVAAGVGFDRAAVERTLAGLGNRMFLMRNVHEDASVLFQSRWALCYLRGPLTLPQIQRLCGSVPPASATTAPPAVADSAAPSPAAPAAGRPAVPPDVREVFLPAGPAAGPIRYRPRVLGVCRLHFVDAATDVDAWVTRAMLAPFSADGGDADWAGAVPLAEPAVAGCEAAPGATFEAPPAGALRAKNFDLFRKTLASYVYQNVTLDLLHCPECKLVSQPGETEGDFRARLTHRLREERDARVETLRKRYAARLAAAEEQVRLAGQRVEREKSQVTQQGLQTAISFGATLLGALMGRKAASVGNLGRATSAVRGVGRTAREREDVARAAESRAVKEQRLADLQAEFEREAEAIRNQMNEGAVTLVPLRIRPRKSDVAVSAVQLAWAP